MNINFSIILCKLDTTTVTIFATKTKEPNMMLKQQILAKLTKINGWIDFSAIIMGQYENADIAWKGKCAKYNFNIYEISFTFKLSFHMCVCAYKFKVNAELFPSFSQMFQNMLNCIFLHVSTTKTIIYWILFSIDDNFCVEYQ